MSYTEDIDQAIIAHGVWKQRLFQAISSGQSEFEVSKVKQDNLCDFGKWFYALPQEIRGSEIGQQVQKLHAEFHGEASVILEMAVNHQKTQAMQKIEAGSSYNHLSGQLTIALSKWKAVI